MKSLRTYVLSAGRALSLLLLLLAFYDQSLRAQVPLPDVKFQDYRSQDVSPLLSEASNASTQSAYESIVDEKIRQVSETWQQDAYQKIQTALLSITDSDTFNDVNAYRAHVEALLIAQKEEAWNGYWAALQSEVTQSRQTFAAALANRTLVSTQASQTSDARAALSISSNPSNAWDTARSALDANHAKWQKEYLAKLENGMRDYEAALRGVTNAEANYNQGIAQTDEEFRTRLAEIQAAENRVRAGVSSQVDGMEASLASSDFFYEENCDAQTNVCTADRSKPTAAALELRSLIDSMRKNIADGAPLSQIGHQMRDYLAAQKASADQHVQHWQSLSYGQLPFSMSANQAPRSAEEWAAWAGRPYAMPSTCSGEGGVCAGVSIALGLMQLGDKFDGTYARGEAGYMLSQSDFKSFADFAANGSNADGVKAYIQSHGENRQVTDILGADIIGLTTNQSYKQLGIQALTVARAPDPMLCVWMGMGNPLLAIGCALLLKDQSPETAFSLTATYKWQDNNAISNASVWSGYSSELAMGQESWDNMLLPALDTWEANTAAYKAKYDQWKTDSAAEAPLMAKKFSDARSTLLADERSYVNQMDQLWTSGEHQWANMYAQIKQAEANAGWYTDRITLSPVHGSQSPAQIAPESANASKLLNDLLANRPAIGTPNVSAQSSLESAYHNYLEGGSSLVGASSTGAPDVRLMDYIGSAMSQSLSGAQNVAYQNQADANAATERQKVIDSLRSAAESSFVDLDYSIPKDNKKKDASTTPPTGNGFTTEMLNGDTIRATRKIATGRALLKPGADPTKADSYTTEMTDQVLYLAPPESVKLSATQSLFSQWDQQDFLAQNAKNEDEFNDGVQNLFAKAGESLNAANYLAAERAAAFRNDASTQASNAATVKSLMVSLLTGGTFGDFMMQSMKGQIATQLEAVTGIPAGMWSAFSGGGTFKQCMGNYLEGLAWQNFETATGLEGLSSIFQAQMKKAEANKKRREAAQLKPEDYIGGGFTYVWRNAETRPGLKRTLGVAETVVFTTLEVVSTIIPAIGNAVAAGVIAGYYATKQAYVGSLHGGTKGAVAGAASGAVNGLIAAELKDTAISPSIDIAYDSETGWSGSVGIQAGKGVKVGGSVTMHEGHGMTGFNVNAGVGISKAASIGANASFDGLGKYQGSQLALNLQNKSGRTFTAGVNFGKAGYSGVTLGTSQSIGDGPEKLSNSQSITLNKDGSKDISASVNASVTDGGRAGLNQFGAGANTSFHIDKRTGITVNQKLNTQLGFQSAKDAAAYLEKLKAQGRTPAERRTQEQRDSDQNKRNQNETKDVLAGSARKKEEEEADSANSAAPSGKGFLDTIADALGDFGQSFVNFVSADRNGQRWNWETDAEQSNRYYEEFKDARNLADRQLGLKAAEEWIKAGGEPSSESNIDGDPVYVMPDGTLVSTLLINGWREQREAALATIQEVRDGQNGKIPDIANNRYAHKLAINGPPQPGDKAALESGLAHLESYGIKETMLYLDGLERAGMHFNPEIRNLLRDISELSVAVSTVPDGRAKARYRVGNDFYDADGNQVARYSAEGMEQANPENIFFLYGMMRAGVKLALYATVGQSERAAMRASLNELERVVPNEGFPAVDHLPRVRSAYPDGTKVYQGEQPPKIMGPDPAAQGSHSVLRYDTVNGRVYQAREFNEAGHPIRDVDFTSPTYPNGLPRPDHLPPPHQHSWFVNDPAIGPRSNFRRGAPELFFYGDNP